ncbi:MAG: histidine phosphatase family protein [Fervidobacterium sp.]|nr:histidine phosphatase family protein [Fervidobacterium sp.]HPZ16859.1 histidine phosphatase family protein [Fervidobacterium sp.]
MARIYLVRHGSTEWNEKRLWQGVVDTELSERGTDEIRKLGVFFRGKNIDMILSSPMKRALQSARIIASEIGYDHNKIVIDDRLKECEIRLWNGKTNEEIDRLYATQFQSWFTNLHSDIEGVEPLGNVQKRMYDFLESMIVHFTNKNVIIVSHAIAIRMLISKILNTTPPNHVNFSLDNGSVSSLIYSGDKVRVSLLNYTHDLL